MMKIIRRLPRHTLVAVILLALSLVLFVLSMLSPAIADFVNFRLGGALRAVPTTLTALLPFSLIEIALLAALPLAAIFLVWMIRRVRNGALYRRVLSLCATTALLFASFYLFTVAPGYRTTPLLSRLSLSEPEMTEEALADTALYLLRESVRLEEGLVRAEDGSTVLGYDYTELSRELAEAYRRLDPRGELASPSAARIKPVLLSTVMSSAHFLGIWSYVTGETNLNTQFPDYTIPYTAAHEMAHQRGIAREDEANFMAFLVLRQAEDPYLRYAGYLGLFEYVASALAAAYPETYDGVVYPEITSGIRAEFASYNAFFDQHKDSTISEVTGSLNDAYLKINGTSGEASYGEVVRLAVAYCTALEP